jgi:DNA-binding response OmpR family regulator
MMNKQTILIIEDNPYISMLLNQLFYRDYNIKIEENGYDALISIQDGNIPDMIISDLTMPKMNGYDFLKNIKSSNLFNKIPLIFLSGEDKSNERIKCLEEGADDFLVKPFNPEELTIRVKNLLNRLKQK